MSGRGFSGIVLTAFLFTVFGSAQDQGILRGDVIEKGTGTPIANVTVCLENPFFETTLTVDGALAFRHIPNGSYRLTATAPGYASAWLDDVVVDPSTPTEVKLELEPFEMRLKEVVVSPGQFSLFRRTNTLAQYIDRDQIHNTPHTADDLFRTLDTIPGVATNDYAAQFNIRGGSYREVLVTLDGVELLEPFHLKGFADGVFTIVDPHIIDGLDLSAGGFTAEYGNALSGVLEMSTITPSQHANSVEISLSGLNARTQNSFANGLGHYLFSARRGYLDIVMNLAEEDDPEEQETNDIAYWDAFGKITYALNSRHSLSASILATGDGFDEEENEDGAYELSNATDENAYTWLGLNSIWTDALTSRTVVSYTNRHSENDSYSTGGDVQYRLRDDRAFRKTASPSMPTSAMPMAWNSPSNTIKVENSAGSSTTPGPRPKTTWPAKASRGRGTRPTV